MGCHSKFARCSAVVLEVFPKMMQELLEKSQIPPSTLHKIILNNKQFKERLSKTELISLQTLSTDGFTKLDVTLIYKIGKFFNLIPLPSRQRGTKPLVHEREIGDDVERIRLKRNDLVHRINCEMTDAELNTFFDEFSELGKRIDVYLGKPLDASFETNIVNYKTSLIDENFEEKYTKELQKIGCLEEKTKLCIKEKVVHVYYGKALEELIRDIKDETDSSSTPLMIIVKGIDGVEEKIALLNSLADQLNDGSATIQFKGAREGSLILKVTVLNRVLQHQQNLMCDLMHFLEHVFKIGNIHELHVETVVDVILAVEEVSFEINDFETAEEFYSSSDGSHSLLMDLEVDNEILLASNTLQESISGFLENILTKTQLFPEKEVTAILLPGANESTSRGNNSADIQSTTAVNSLIQNMDINQETEQAQALTYKSESELLTELGLKMYYPDKIGYITSQYPHSTYSTKIAAEI